LEIPYFLKTVKTKTSPTVVGLFVLGALALTVIALLSFGGFNFFAKPERFVVYFDESAHGLDIGSPVKLRGVRMGRVTQLQIRQVDVKANGGSVEERSLVGVVCELSRDVVTDAAGVPVDISSRSMIEEMVGRGLVARLNISGLATGLLYVELDYLGNGAERPALTGIPTEDYPEVPAQKSSLAELQKSITDIAAKFSQMDLAKFASDLQGLVADLRLQIQDADIKALVTEWTAAGRSLRELAASPELKATLANLESSTRRLDVVLADLEKNLAPATAELAGAVASARATLDEFNQTAKVVRRFVGAQQDLGSDASAAFVRLSQAAEAVARLADFLERNPSALISGRAAEATAQP
jgi:paraquat-inducible protein B